MKSVTRMFWWLALIILAAGLFFVGLDDEDTKAPPLNPPAAGAPQ